MNNPDKQIDASNALIGLICDEIAQGGDGSRVFNAAREEMEQSRCALAALRKGRE